MTEGTLSESTELGVSIVRRVVGPAERPAKHDLSIRHLECDRNIRGMCSDSFDDLFL